MQIEMIMQPMAEQIVQDARSLFTALNELDQQTRIETINRIREELREYSPFKAEPVDWVVSQFEMLSRARRLPEDKS